jgi:hypothetical protein
VPEHVAVGGQEVLAHRHELEQGMDVAVRQLPGVAVERVESSRAHERRDQQREDKRPERDAETRGELEVGEERHGNAAPEKWSSLACQ